MKINRLALNIVAHFTVKGINKRTRKTYYWEHLGLVSDADYALQNFKKLQDYEASGYQIARDLIITMESTKMPLKVEHIEDKIKTMLL